MKNLNLKKFFIYLLVGSVVVSAFVGIGVLLFGNLGERAGRVLVSTSIITITSILGLACGALYETGRYRLLPVGGIGLAVLSAVLWIIFIWYEPADAKIYVRFVASTTILAISCSHLSLLSLARLDRKFLWSLYTAHFAVWSLSAILLYIVWFDPRTDSDLILRVNGILSIIITAITILTPIFHRLSVRATDVNAIEAEILQLQTRIAELEKQKAEMIAATMKGDES